MKIEVVILLGSILVTATLAARMPLVPATEGVAPGSASQNVGAAGTGTGAPSVAGIDSRDLTVHVRALAADSMEGRRTGEPGADRAATYIEQAFARLGLEPGAGDQGYRQVFEAEVGARLGGRNRLALRSARRSADLVLDTDWRPLAFATSTHGPVRAGIVFCGYGITSTDPPYDDYDGVDVEGQVVLCLRLEPGADDPESPFDGTALTFHSDLRNKAKNALDHGAVGILYVTGPSTAESAADLLPFDERAAAGAGHLPSAQISRDALAPFLSAAEVDLARIQERIDREFKPASLPVDMTVEVEIAVNPIEARTFNVIGVLPGSDAAGHSDAIVIGAHYDHLGRGGMGSLAPDSHAIHNGADDNASGVAAMLEIAESLVSRPEPLDRSLIFIAFTGEEMGLLGSSYYVEHPVMPLAVTRVMINLDMIGRGKERQILVGGVGSSPSLSRIVDKAARDASIVPTTIESGYGPSDHTPFYAREVPVLFFFTQPHEDYHRPTDDWEKIDYSYLADVAALVEDLIVDLADDGVEIAFTRADDQAPSHPGRGGEGYGGRGYGSYLGTVPDFTPSTEGVRLTGVRDGSPAAAAGIQGGDIITGWNGRPILNLQDYAQALRSHRPGDQVEITILRDGAEITARATLGERP